VDWCHSLNVGKGGDLSHEKKKKTSYSFSKWQQLICEGEALAVYEVPISTV